MSTSRGNDTRKRPQKHQNRTGFKNNLHDTSHRTKFINSIEVTGVCKRCKDIIEWKIKYKKYKPLTAPRKCLTCEEKTVKYAYHMMCTHCAKDKKVCAKCCKSVEEQEIETISDDIQDLDLKSMLKKLPERKRRTILRHINNLDGQQTDKSEIKGHIEDMLAKMDNINIDDDDSFSESDGSYHQS